MGIDRSMRLGNLQYGISLNSLLKNTRDRGFVVDEQNYCSKELTSGANSAVFEQFLFLLIVYCYIFLFPLGSLEVNASLQASTWESADG